MKLLPSPLPLLVFSIVIAALCAEARTWTEEASGRTLEGELLRTEGEVVLIRRANGAVLKVPVASLSAADREVITAAAAAQAEEKAAATAAEKNVYKWETDFELASKRAKEEGKHMLLDFTGSDWCGWCMKLKAEVFEKKEFQEFAAEKLVLVELDFPRAKKQSAAEKRQNEALQREHEVRGFPTIVLLDPRGKVVGKTGYRDGGPRPYVKHLEEMMR